MNWSKYNHIFKSEKHGSLLFNSLTSSFLGLTTEACSFIENNTQNPSVLVESEFGEILMNTKCLVESDEDELNAISYFSLLSKTNRNELNLTIAPTYHCNFSCVYCYEVDRPPIYMSEETQELLVQFIKSFTDVNNINITWYGGEPLMGDSVINKLTNDILGLGKTINSFIVTNGYLLNQKNIELLKSNNILNAQITLDGLKYEHDLRRPLTNGKGTFDTIISNIDNLFKEIPEFTINFRVNIDKKNYHKFIDIYNFLEKHYEGKKISISPGFVDEINVCASVNSCNFNRRDKVEFIKNTFIYHRVDLGIYPTLERDSCIAQVLNGYVIGADGNIFKCWNDIGIKEKAVSNLQDPRILNKKLYFRYLNSANNFYDKKCLNCKLLPMCNGGCQYLRIANEFDKANIDTCHLAKDNLDEFLELYYETKQKSE